MIQASTTDRIDCGPTAPKAARLLVAEALRNAGQDGRYPYAELVVCQLVANAVRESKCAQVRMDVDIHDDGRLRLVVIDPELSLPQPRPADARKVNSQGLDIFDAVAADWGVEVYGDAKAVWVELRAACA